MNIFQYWREVQLAAHSPRIDRPKNVQLLRLYHSLDQAIARFQKSSGLRCLPGCGECCENPKVETTVLEMLPLAADLFQRREAEKIIERLNGLPPESICVFYQKNSAAAAKGCCTAYSFRPTICRLFGFSTVNDKRGKPELVTCRLMKEHFFKQYAQVNATQAPAMRDYSQQVFNIDCALGKDRLPINQALRVALERAGYYLETQQRS